MSEPTPDEPVRGHGPWVDLHAHPGRCFVGGPGVASAASAVRAAGLAASSFSTVGDLRILGFDDGGGIVQTREFEPGEAEQDHDRQLRVLEGLGAGEDVVVVDRGEDVLACHRDGKTGALLTAEGADFLGDDLAGLEAAHRRGLGAVTVVHYAQNRIGDVQTSPARHDGLSAFGRDVIREMNRLGMLVDLAHATFRTTLDAIDVSTAPVVISHSHLASPGAQHPRLLSEDHARAVAASGGLVGAWPSGVANETLDDFADEIGRLVDLLGVEHVAVGTDLDANYRPVLTRHEQYADLDARLARRGLDPADRDAVLGGNVVALLQRVLGGRDAPAEAGSDQARGPGRAGRRRDALE